MKCLPGWPETVRPWYGLGGAEGGGNSGKGRGCIAPSLRPCRPWLCRLRWPSRCRGDAQSGTHFQHVCTPLVGTRDRPIAETNEARLQLQPGVGVDRTRFETLSTGSEVMGSWLALQVVLVEVGLKWHIRTPHIIKARSLRTCTYNHRFSGNHSKGLVKQ